MSQRRDLSTLTLDEYLASIGPDQLDAKARLDPKTGEIALVVCAKGDGAELLFNVLSAVIDMPNPLPEPGAAQA